MQPVEGLGAEFGDLQGDLFLLLVAECLHRDRPVTMDDVAYACATAGIRLTFTVKPR